jgi:hypothetical protein
MKIYTIFLTILSILRHQFASLILRLPHAIPSARFSKPLGQDYHLLSPSEILLINMARSEAQNRKYGAKFLVRFDPRQKLIFNKPTS